MKARRLAWDIICDVFIEGKYAGLSLKEKLTKVAEVDKGLVTEIVYGTLRNYRFLFFQFEHLLERKVDLKIKLLLALSIYQLMYLDRVPSYAVINEAVDLAKTYKKAAFSGLVNAVFRNFIRLGSKAVTEPAIRYSFPDHIVDLINKQYNEDLTLAFLKAGNQPTVTVLRANELKTSTKRLLRDPEFYIWEDEALRYRRDIFNSSYFKDGLVVVQDAGSQAVAKWMEPKAGERILDVCAAPGTKTAQMAALMQNSGKIIALDIHEHRLALLTQAMDVLGVKIVETAVLDAREASNHYQKESFDQILVDAPCSGLGVLKGKPEIKIRLKSEDMDSMVGLQRDILSGVADLLKVGGKLTYSTCTLNLNENQNQVKDFLASHENYELIKQRTIWPNNRHDGFYLASLLRKA